MEKKDEKESNGVRLDRFHEPGEYEIVVPSVSILCQPTVAIVDEVVDYRGSREIATEYLDYLYTEDAQNLVAFNYYRPSDQSILEQYVTHGDSRTIAEIPQDNHWIVSDIDLTDIEHFSGWSQSVSKHFADGGLFDAIYEK